MSMPQLISAVMSGTENPALTRFQAILKYLWSYAVGFASGEPNCVTANIYGVNSTLNSDFVEVAREFNL